jgi:RNA recognition motif-containing protein
MEQTKLFLGNLPSWAEKSGIERIFSAYGDVLDVEVPKHRVTEEPLGYAIITFYSPQAAERALVQDGKVIAGKIVEVRYLE